MSTNYYTLLENMILSASGWRGIFTSSLNENDNSATILEEHKAIVTFAAKAFSEYIKQKCGKKCTIVVGTDSRPTGKEIANTMLKSFVANDISIRYVGIVAAPEIMSYARDFDGFAYISASHNPIGHNGIKFGFSDGGVMPASESKILIDNFKILSSSKSALLDAKNILQLCNDEELNEILNSEAKYKDESYKKYYTFSKRVISGENDKELQNVFFDNVYNSMQEKSLTIVCDMNGSARTKSIDKEFFCNCSIDFIDFNNTEIEHEIIPEGNNLKYCAKKIEELQLSGKTDALLGYMPDCDGDRGNIVYWNKHTKKAEILQAQEVFALSVLSELSYSLYRCGIENSQNLGVAVNGATSMRIDEIAKAFNATVFRAEVGEANIVNCAREQRGNGYTIPIMGEGSNGGNITHPAAVRDPINTIFALIKLLVLRSTSSRMGLFELWCSRSNQMDKYKSNFDFVDIMNTLPQYSTTGVSEERALLNITTRDHKVLKDNFQVLFQNDWNNRKVDIIKSHGFYSWKAVATVGINEIQNIENFGVSGSGGLKILFMDKDGDIIASMWMRGSGTESVFRVMADIKDGTENFEKDIIAWETELLVKADKM